MTFVPNYFVSKRWEKVEHQKSSSTAYEHEIPGVDFIKFGRLA
jgi:hypothetical protein